jgi:hypothetical protein
MNYANELTYVDVNELPLAPSLPKRRVRRPVLHTLLAVAVAVIAAQLAYTWSGSSKWEFVEEKQGIKLYSMKVPGENIRRFLSVFRIKSTLNQAVAFMQDDDSDVSDVGFYDSDIVKQDSINLRWTTWKMRFPRPMTDRQFIVRHSFTQDPKTKEVLYALDATPAMLPEDNCCVRIRKLANSWRLIPEKNGEIEIHWVIDADFGGFIPYFMLNRRLAWEMFDFGSGLQEIVSRKKYLGAKTGWVDEM